MNILDSSVVLAYIRKEKGGDFLQKLFKESVKTQQSIFIHQVNLMEVIYKVKIKLPDYDLSDLLAEFSSPWWGKLTYMDSDLMLFAAELKSRSQNISLADCIGLSAAKIFKATFWTADQLLADIGKAENISVKLIK
jgi:predicted nucleic acid-binding protein